MYLSGMAVSSGSASFILVGLSSILSYVLLTELHLLKTTSRKTLKISPIGSDDDDDPDSDPAPADLSKLREDCLLHDNNHCIISRHYDLYQTSRKEREGC